ASGVGVSPVFDEDDDGHGLRPPTGHRRRPHLHRLSPPPTTPSTAAGGFLNTGTASAPPTAFRVLTPEVIRMHIVIFATKHQIRRNSLGNASTAY
ncbi:hypothetical protein H0H81_011323, partial [Sphagnurus paluster]